MRGAMRQLADGTASSRWQWKRHDARDAWDPHETLVSGMAWPGRIPAKARERAPQ